MENRKIGIISGVRNIERLSKSIKLVQETIDNKNYEQFKKDALEYAEKHPIKSKEDKKQ